MKYFIVGLHSSGKQEVLDTLEKMDVKCGKLFTNLDEKTLKALSNFMPKKPFRESLADYLCPSCRGYLPYDALNQPIKEAPEFCSCCGQHIYWDKPEEW